ncbi:hypothetical protein SAMN04488122_4356 [Chitinophaga arvensicola]|uniref:Uncharacterized protein n=1 Tax=Chitinophaga arvensicola TaxID=29529 RepID=A0A1I0S7D5_9BACT|nr:hypothetical protein SAMN04488122_4356 [Chitinophaga arvensicola]
MNKIDLALRIGPNIGELQEGNSDIFIHAPPKGIDEGNKIFKPYKRFVCDLFVLIKYLA